MTPMDGLNLLNLIKYVAVLVAAMIVGNWFLNKNDPNRLRFFDLRKLRKANAKQEQKINDCLNRRDVAGINRILSRL